MFLAGHVVVITLIYNFFIKVFFIDTFIDFIFFSYLIASTTLTALFFQTALKIKLMYIAKITFDSLYIFETFVLIIKSFSISSIFVIIRASVPRYKFVQLISIC